VAVLLIRKKLDITRQAFRDYYNALFALVEKAKFNDREDFTVVIQPFFIETDIPRKPDGKPDDTYFAPDCFHFSGKAHSAAAVGLYNNIVQKVGKKDKSWHLGENILCPTASDFIWTTKNS